MTFYVENETDKEFPFSIQETFEKVALKVLETEKCPYETSVNMLLTNNAGIREYNNRYRGIDKETDVLSFPNIDFETAGGFDIVEGQEADYFDLSSGELFLGDIIISVEKIEEQAHEYGHSALREFAFLTAHSMFHLCGYDHMTDEETAVMEKKQEEALKSLGIGRNAS